ncbi:MAG: phage holin family protein [Thermoleophilaceae bacterium]
MAVHTADDRSIGEVVQRLSAQTGQLVRQELRLAQLELQEKGRHAGIGAGIFGAAGITALVGRKEVGDASPLKPEQAIQTTRHDVEHLRESARR